MLRLKGDGGYAPEQVKIKIEEEEMSYILFLKLNFRNLLDFSAQENRKKKKKHLDHRSFWTYKKERWFEPISNLRIAIQVFHSPFSMYL